MCTVVDHGNIQWRIESPLSNTLFPLMWNWWRTTGAATHSLGLQCTCLLKHRHPWANWHVKTNAKQPMVSAKSCFSTFTQVCGSQNSSTSNATLSIESTLAESWCKSEESGKDPLTQPHSPKSEEGGCVFRSCYLFEFNQVQRNM